jgi:hypothetical protein
LAGRRVGWRLGEGGSPLQSPRRIPTWRGWPSLIGAVASADLRAMVCPRPFAGKEPVRRHYGCRCLSSMFARKR